MICTLAEDACFGTFRQNEQLAEAQNNAQIMSCSNRRIAQWCMVAEKGSKRALQYCNLLVLIREDVRGESYISLAGPFGLLANAVRTECCKELHPTLQFVQTKD
jgi:hypothetical protein